MRNRDTKVELIKNQLAMLNLQGHSPLKLKGPAKKRDGRTLKMKVSRPYGQQSSLDKTENTGTYHMVDRAVHTKQKFFGRRGADELR